MTWLETWAMIQVIGPFAVIGALCLLVALAHFLEWMGRKKSK